jgi:Tol biopolymer transport system component
MAWANHPSHGRKFYLYEDKTDKVEVMAPHVMTVNGHNTYLPGNRWILNDTYPDKERLQHPYLFDTKTGRRHALGHFLSPKEYSGEWRCDTHPRYSPNGKMVTIDSPHNGGRQIHLIDISAIVG